MAIPVSKLSDLLAECLSPAEALSRLREEGLLDARCSDDEILALIQKGQEESAAEVEAYGFTWASADTRIADKLSHGYLSKKGDEWFASRPHESSGASTKVSPCFDSVPIMTQSISSPRSSLHSRLVTAASVVFALVAFALALLGFLVLSSVGFPDGHVTDYERAAQLPRIILLGMNLALGVYLIRLAIPNLNLRTRIIRLMYVVFALGLLLAIAEVAIPWYLISHLGLNDGGGA